MKMQKTIHIAVTMLVLILTLAPLTSLAEELDGLEDLIAAADQGDVVDQLYLGVLYYLGEGVEQDYEKAFARFTKAAGQGHSEAQAYLEK